MIVYQNGQQFIQRSITVDDYVFGYLEGLYFIELHDCHVINMQEFHLGKADGKGDRDAWPSKLKPGEWQRDTGSDWNKFNREIGLNSIITRCQPHCSNQIIWVIDPFMIYMGNCYRQQSYDNWKRVPQSTWSWNAAI